MGRVEATMEKSIHREPSLTVDSHRTPHPFFVPTHLRLKPDATSDQTVEWQSRRARKGRYTSKLHHVGSGEGQNGKDDSHSIYLRIQNVEDELKPHLVVDVSFWIAILFTLGSVVWVVNGFLVWFPDLRPNLATTAFSLSGAATAFVGGSVFELGSYLMVVEALDRGRESNFGTALGKVLHHRRRMNNSSSNSNDLSANSSRTNVEDEQNGPEGAAKGFVWWGKPMWHDLGYLAALVQLFAATIFWVSTLTGLPGVIPGFAEGEGSVAIVDVFFWTPQVIGGMGFIVSSLILMIEVQTKWYIPKVTDIGWWVGSWNLVGAFGFMLCGAFGYSPASGMVYESGCSTFWGSWAFLIGSCLQVWEVVWREPPK
ncbi:hypothetical protein P7C73_g6752, partial [Tremellales sp. Uapishka_1]